MRSCTLEIVNRPWFLLFRHFDGFCFPYITLSLIFIPFSFSIFWFMKMKMKMEKNGFTLHTMKRFCVGGLVGLVVLVGVCGVSWVFAINRTDLLRLILTTRFLSYAGDTLILEL